MDQFSAQTEAAINKIRSRKGRADNGKTFKGIMKRTAASITLN